MKYLFVFLYLIVLISCEKTLNDDDNAVKINILEDGSKKMQVHLEKAGSLYNFILPSDTKNLSILMVSGEINGDDIDAIRALTKRVNEKSITLRELDLSNVKLVHGGSYIYSRVTYTTENKKVKKIIEDIKVENLENDAIPSYAFASLSGLERIILPSNIKKIGNYAFEKNNVKELIIPNSVTDIGKCAFYFSYIKNKIIISEGVKSLPDSVFCLASQIPEIVLPRSLTSIGKHCFSECYHLETIRIYNPMPPICDKDMWNLFINKSLTLYVPNGSLSLYMDNPIWGRVNNIIEE